MRSATSVHRWSVGALLLLGVGLWALALWASYTGSMRLIVIHDLESKALGLATCVLLTAPLRRMIFAAMVRMRHPTPRARRITAAAIVVFSAAYLLRTTYYQHRALEPRIHDEYMHLVQMQLLAHGHLWLPAHPLADFFETFHVFVKPVYAPLHFPGTSLLYTPAVWLHLPPWVQPWIVASIIVGLVYLIITELVDGAAGLLAAIVMLSLASFRYVSVMVISNPVAMLFGLLMVWSWLHWRRQPQPRPARWAIAIGLFAGFAAITRPPDAICFAIPVGIVMLLDLRRSPWRERMIAIGLPIAAALPFLALQVLFDHGVTGHWLRTPHDLYSSTFNPGVNYGLRNPDLTQRPQTTLLQKQQYYDWFVKPYVALHRPDQMGEVIFGRWFPAGVRATLPAPALLALVPVGLLGLTSRRRILFAALLPLGFALYTLSVMISAYYLLFVAPAVLLCVLLGMRQVELAWPGARQFIAPGLALFVLAFAFTALPEVQGEDLDVILRTPTLELARQKLAEIHEPAIVLFKYRSGDNFHEEPVYNTEFPNPDDAPIIRAHDLGARNVDLVRYYAQHQPERAVYRFDRRLRTLVRLGNVKDLAIGDATTMASLVTP
jgi:hypothetical protein